MATAIAAINEALQRNIKSGKEYSKYFKPVPCKVSNAGYGDTTYTLELMKQGVAVHKHQTVKIAEVLKTSSVPKTVQNIYNFLYNHLQYFADGYHQQLRTPWCSWSSRKLGIDCKSYSVFAGCILANLKIPFKFRKITQPGSPDKWSHVYVIIPYKNKELVIDATKKVNEEPDKVYEFDMSVNLPHSWLNGAAALQVSERDSVMISAINTFKNDFLPSLENQGVSKFVTNRILEAVKVSVANGLDPQFNITNSSITIDGSNIPFGTTIKNGLQGLGIPFPAFGAIASAVSGGGAGNTQTGGAGNIFGSLTSLFSGIGRTPDSAGISRIVNPLKDYITNLLNSANASNKHLKVTEADKLIASTIKHEEKVNSRFSQVALPELRKMLQELRSTYAALPKQMTSADGSRTKSFWTAGATNVHAGTVSYYQYSAANVNTGNVSFMPTATNQTNFLDTLLNIGNGLLMDPKTNQTYTPEQVNQIRYQNAQNSGAGSNSESGLSTTAIVGLSVAGLIVAGLAAKKMNLI